MSDLKLPKFHPAKLFSILFFILLLGAYANIFAIGIYAPGETLDPTCTPGSLDCTVNIGSGGSGWGLVGNSGTSIGTDFIGTTDDVDLQFRRNNIVAGQIGNSNTSFGLAALSSNTTGSANTANGAGALFSNTTGSQNTANGAGVLFFNTTGSQNTANGFSALSGNTTGFANTASGDNSLSFNTTGNHNTANGAGALIFNTTGNFNAALGYAAGMYIANDIIGNSTSNNSVYLGYDTRASADGNNNEIVIGANTIGNGSNTTTIGNTSILRTYLTGVNLKAGTATSGTAPLKLTSGTNLGTTEAGAIEYDGSHLYFTATNGGSRYQLDQQGGSMSIGGAITSATQGSILFAGAGGVLSQNNTNFNWNNGTSQFTLGGNLSVNGGSLTYLNNTGLIDIANTADFTGVAGETSIGLKIKPVLTITEPASGTFTHYGQVIDLSGISISDGAGFSEVSGLSIIGSNDGGATITLGIDISSVASNPSDQTGLSIGSGWDKGIKFYESDSVGGTETDYISINAPASVTTSYDLFFPSTQGGVNTYLKNDGSGGLSWATASGSLLSDADFNTKGGTDAGLNYVAGAQNNTFLGYQAGRGGVVTNQADHNTAIGYESLLSNTSGYNNTANGALSLRSNTWGTSNTANGYRALYYNTYGHNNIAIGTDSLFSNTTGSNNTASGYQSLRSNTTGSWNVADGYNSLYSSTTGGYNTASGANSFYSNKTGSNGVALGFESQKFANDTTTPWTNFNTSIGYQSLMGSTTPANNTGTYNTAVGYNSLYSNTTGFNNTASGHQSLYSNTTGSSNTANGSSTLALNTTGSYNTANGSNSLLSNTTGIYNTATGVNALAANTDGHNNTASGYNSLTTNSTGYYNTGSGNYSLYSNTTGGYNTASGFSSLRSNTTGSFNTAIGLSSLYSNTTGSNNIAIGTAAGQFQANGATALTAPENSIYIGGDTRGFNDTDSNSIVIGYQAIGNGSNTATIGNTSLLRTYLTGVNLKAGTATAGTAPLKLTSGTNLSTTEAGAIEYDGSHLYFTATNGGTRYQLDQQGGGTPPITVVNSSNLFSTALTGTGTGATSLTGSIFLGEYSGEGAVNASGSNFLGVYTGNYAINASNSNFIGNQSGGGAENASYSNFIGSTAGLSATNSSGSNFIGSAAGMGATDSQNSNFIGMQSGFLATSAQSSNFIGHSSGSGASNAAYSNFIGHFAGFQAINAINSNFLGSSSGYSADNANNSIFIGQGAGMNDTVNNTGNVDDFSILIGKDTTTGSFSNSIALGGSARNTASNQFVIGSTTRPIDTTVVYGSASTQCTLTTGVGVSCTSDERLKTNITDLSTDTLDKLIQIKTVNFNWKEGNSETNNIGFLAQDLEQYFPEMVATNAEGYKSVYYSNMTPLIVEAIRELDLKVKDFSSLDTSIATSLGSLIKQFIEDEVNRFEKIFAKTIVTEGIEMKDTATGEDYCVVITNGEFERILGKCGEPIVQTEFEDVVEEEISEIIPEIDPTDDISTDEPEADVIIEEVGIEEIIEPSSPIIIEEVIDVGIPSAPQETEIITQ